MIPLAGSWPGDWVYQAACQGMHPDLFFPGEGGHVAAAVLAVCAGCPVRAECAAWAVNELDGMWAGTSAKQRNRARGGRAVKQTRARIRGTNT